FAGDREPPADLLERHLAVEAEAVAEAKDFAFAIRQWSHRALDLVGQFAADSDLLWRTTGGIAHEVAERRLLALADRRFQRSRMPGGIEQQLHFRYRYSHAAGELVGSRLAPQVSQQRRAGPRQLVQRFHHMHRQPDDAAVIGHGASDALPDPPRRIG